MYHKTLDKRCGYCERSTCAGCKYLQCSRPDLRHTYHRTVDDVAANIPRNIKNVMKPRCERSYFNKSEEKHGTYSCRELESLQHLRNPPNIANYNEPAHILSENDRSRSSHKFSNASANSSSDCLRHSGVEALINNSSRIYCEKPSRPNPFNSDSHKHVTQNSQKRQLVEQNDRVIFKTQSHDLLFKKITERVLVTVECNKDHISNYESWKPLSEFLISVTNQISSTFSAIHKGRKITVSGYCSDLYMESITKIVQQFAYRSSSERSDMYMNFDLNIQKLYQHLNYKLLDMIKVSDDVLNLYKELKELKLEIIESDGQVSEDLRNSLELKKMRFCLKKLLMILYRADFADECLKKLKEISFKLSHQLQQGLSQTTLPVFLEYVYHFNCVFASHEPKALADWIRNYECHIYRSQHDPLPKPVSATDRNDQPFNSEMCANTSTYRSANDPKPSMTHTSLLPKTLDHPVTCQASRTLSSNAPSQQPGLTSHPSVDSAIKLNNPSANVSFSSMTKPMQNSKNSSKNKSRLFVLERPSKEYNQFYLKSMVAKTKLRRKKAKIRFRAFIDDAHHCLREAHTSNSPHSPKIQKLIDDFEDKLRNEYFILKPMHLNIFKKLVKEEKQRTKLKSKKQS